MPVSDTLILTSLELHDWAVTLTPPPLGVNFIALDIRLYMICLILRSSAWIVFGISKD